MKHLVPMPIYVVVLSLLWSASPRAQSDAAEPTAPKTRVPHWDAHGVGPLPWQGVACLDVNEDASRIALGTIAPSGDPNVLILDADGKLLKHQQAGQRWINQITLGDGDNLPRALCTMPAGKAGDMPEIFRLNLDKVVPEGISWHRSQYADGYFHYADHTNHVARLLARHGSFIVAANADQVHWLGPTGIAATSTHPLQDTAIPVSLAVGPKGIVVVGTTASETKSASGSANLFLHDSSHPKPIWSRAINSDVDQAARPEKGQYGTPTLPDGRCEEIPQEDRRIWAPLAVAIHVEEKASWRVAAADYQGWQRWVRSSATQSNETLGVRFMPSRPTITIYDQAGKTIRRFGPETFAHPFWCNIAFFPDGNRLLVSPHSWTCRGLAAQSMLPADDDARDLYVLDVGSGKVTRITFPDAVSDVAISARGVIAGCWDGRVYLLNASELKEGKPPVGIEVGGPSLVRVSKDGSKIVVAGTSGIVRLLDATGKQVWQNDLNKTVPHGLKPWVDKARATPIAKGVWQMPGGRTESDLGGQRLIEAPDGLILIEGHAGMSFEAEWAAIQAVGLDPMRVKYVLATHEHGDHAPGAYLWRVVAGAQFICSPEMAYTLQHHIPMNTGYGFHPPVPTDIRVKEDSTLDLAGLKVEAIRIPGHTFGSMAWRFEKNGKSYVSFGDLIMPRGVLGYAGSINFSATDVLSSLRKLQALKPDVVLPGHGAVGPPGDTLGAGVEVAVKAGWGLIRPEKPDPYFRISQKNILVAGWNTGATSISFGDVDGDGLPDVATVSKTQEGSRIRLYINKAGKFHELADHEIALPTLADPSKIRILPVTNKEGRADIFVGGKSAALLLPDGKSPRFKIIPLDFSEGNQVRMVDEGNRRTTVIGSRFGGFHVIDDLLTKPRISKFIPEVTGPYADLKSVDLNGDVQPDLVTSYGRVYLRGADGKLPAKPTRQLLVEKGDWCFLAVGDFNADGRPDIALLAYGMNGVTSARIFYSHPELVQRFSEKPDNIIPLNDPRKKNEPFTLVRDTPVVTDWNGDGIDDIIIGRGQSSEVLVLLGGREGLDAKRSETISLDYRVHYETGLFVGDFNGDGLPDLAVSGYTNTGVGASGPLAGYIWLQPARPMPNKK